MNIFFDFDGVILDSLDIKEVGFREIFSNYQKTEIEELIKFHRKNLGKSRFIKIKFFYNKILKKKISEKKIKNYSNFFSKIMKKNLNNKSRLIKDSVWFIKKKYKKNNLYIVSGTEQKELRWLCKSLRINKYFQEIDGSPESKQHLIMNIMKKHSLLKSNSIMIGDSVNDYEAAKYNNIKFYGFNNYELCKKNYNYVSSLKKIKTF